MMFVDGYIEAQNPDEYWHNWNEEMSGYMMDFFKTVDTFIYGRKSYEDMIAYWPPLNGEFARFMNETPKLVFSNTLEDVSWNARLVKVDPKAEIEKQKHKEGKNMVLFAGADLAATFIRENLIDEYRLIVNPIVLGGGKPIFKNVIKTLNLTLKEVIPFNCGNVILIYKPKNDIPL